MTPDHRASRPRGGGPLRSCPRVAADSGRLGPVPTGHDGQLDRVLTVGGLGLGALALRRLRIATEPSGHVTDDGTGPGSGPVGKWTARHRLRSWPTLTGPPASETDSRNGVETRAVPTIPSRRAAPTPLNT